jgi:ATP synthase protein I
LTATTSTEIFSKMLKIQLIAVSALSVVMLLVFGVNESVSSVLGGASVILGSYLASLISKKSVNVEDASAVLVNLLKAEAVKIFTIILSLFLVFKFYALLVPFALIAGLAATAIFSGAALSKLNV